MQLKQFLQSSFNKQDFIEFITERFYGFAPNLEQDEYLGKVRLDDKSEIGFFVFVVDDSINIENNRVFLSNLATKEMSDKLLDGAISVFYNTKNIWRLTFTRFSYSDNHKKEILNQKRFTYILGIQAINTPLVQFEREKNLNYKSILEIQNDFSVEKVSKEFFEEYKKLFEKLNKHLESQIALFGRENDLHAFTKKLLGRIVFLYFLQKKGWLGVSKNGVWGEGNKNFLSEMYKKSSVDFYSKQLSVLFFDTLNQRREEDYSAEFECKIPFLNGGLFDKNQQYDESVFIDDALFGEIFETFNRYNFTILEDSPDESEIAIDPEMLGRVFENLLEENYRKGKGAFYTPREIVSYMCKSSIEHYLEEATKEHRYTFGVDEFLELTKMSDDKIADFYLKHPQKYILVQDYFHEIKPYKNLVVGFMIMAKLRGFVKEDRKLTKSSVYKGHQEISPDIWHKILKKEYLYYSHIIGSNKQIRINNKLFVYPTLIKYIQIEERFFALAFLPNIFGDLELSTIFPIREKGIKSKTKLQNNIFEMWNADDFSFDTKVLEELKSLWRDEHSPHTDPHQSGGHNTAVRFSMISHKLFKSENIANHDLRTHLSLKWYDLKVNKILNNSTITQNDLIDIMLKKIKQIKVLDPAIGSGAFPMGMLHEIVQTRVHLGDKTPHDKLKREIIENSIYGVDIDFDAVEIAKLRFWLSLTVDEDTPSPLPNLDFKIMQGNSLVETINGFSPIPSDIYDKQKKQMTTLFDTKALSLLDKKIFDRLTSKIHDFYRDSTGDKKQSDKDEIKTLIREIIEGYLKSESKEHDAREKDLHLFASNKKQLANTIVSKRENISIAKTVLAELLANNFQTKELFLYKLFFGEVLKEGGFDVVIGNPPYIRQEKIKDLKPKLQIEGYKSFNGTADIYIYFFEQGYRLLKDGGVLSFITSNKYARAKYGKEFRDFVLKNTNILEYIDFNGVKVFESATVDTSILSFRKSASVVRPELVEGSCGSTSSPRTESSFLYCDITAEYKKGENLTTFCDKNGFLYAQNDLSIDSFSFANPKELQIKKRIEAIGTPLKKWDIKINYGIKTGFNEAFIIDTAKRDELIAKDAKSAEIIKPMLRGRDIKRYGYEWAELYVVGTFPALNINIDEYPAVKEYLESFGARLDQSGAVGSRKKTGNKWFETQDQIAYWEEFKKEKIVYPDIGVLSFCLDSEKMYFNNTVYFLNTDSKYCLAILNSKVVSYWYSRVSSSLGEGGSRGFKIFVELIPIPKIPQEAQKPFEILVDYILFAKANKMTKEALLFESIVDGMVYDLYFEEEMKKADCYIADEVQKLLKEFDETDEMLKSMYKEFKENKSIMRGLTYSRTVEVVKIINGEKND